LPGIAGEQDETSGSADLLAPFPARPKGMHRRTFQRLRARAEAAMYGSNRDLP